MWPIHLSGYESITIEFSHYPRSDICKQLLVQTYYYLPQKLNCNIYSAFIQEVPYTNRVEWKPTHSFFLYNF